MHARPKKKLCWNCEGGVALVEENCPYCGVYLHPGASSEEPKITSLFSPPYPQPEHEEIEETEVVHAPEAVVAVKQISEEDWKPFLITWLLLVSGLIFSLFGLVIFLFSENGHFTLSWHYESAWLFTCMGIPLLLLGWRYLKSLLV